ncbi:MAG: CinA family nicotinamide mononucleotide deamidase-related protein [Chitinophagaceae bacterium]
MTNQQIPCAVITIGDELLIGQTIDTNSAWIAQQVRPIGLFIKFRMVVGDNQQDIIKALEDAKKNVTVIFVTGGLGPTLDDKTKKIVTEYFDTSLKLHDPTLKNIEQFFKTVNMPLTDRNIQQAYLPSTAIVVSNDVGTAPGMWFERDKQIFIFMPGVPSEMIHMMQETIIPQLSKIYHAIIEDRYITTIGEYESSLADILEGFEKSLPEDMSLAYLPNAFGFVKLRLTAYGKSVFLIDRYFEELKNLLLGCIVTMEDKSIVEVVAELLIKNKKTISTAESCTGGYIAHLLTQRQGSSSYYYGSIVSYHTAVKKKLLQVKELTILDQTLVSEEVAKEMIQGTLKILNTDYAIAVTGVMGPDGGTRKIPIGTVCIAVGNHTTNVSKIFYFRGSRMQNIESTAQHALNMLRVFMLNQE